MLHRAICFILFFTLSVQLRADDIFLPAEDVAAIQEMNRVGQRTATRVTVPIEILREAFAKLLDKETTRVPVEGSDDSVLISRTGNNLQILAVIDNIGTEVNINRKIRNFMELGSKGRVEIDRSFNNVFVHQISGNVGSVININIDIDNRVVASGSPRTKRADGAPRSEDVGYSAPPAPQQQVAAATAGSGTYYNTQAGNTMRFPNGYCWWNPRTGKWILGSKSDITWTFNNRYYVYAY